MAIDKIKRDGKDYQPIYAENGVTVNGVIITQNGSGTCADGAANSFTSKITCDADVKTLDVNDVNLEYSDDVCHFTVEFAHEAGCTFDLDSDYVMDQVSNAADESLGWLYENEWAVGIIYVIAGPLIALFGAAWFPYIVAAIVAIFFIGTTCMISLSAGWMATTTGTAVTCSVAVVLGIIAGCVVRRNFKLMLGLLGLISGFFSGSLLFALISGMSGWNAIWGFWVISAVMAIIGCVATIYLGMPVVMVATSMVGSYLFMRPYVKTTSISLEIIGLRKTICTRRSSTNKLGK